jgi:hypothetical protein
MGFVHFSSTALIANLKGLFIIRGYCFLSHDESSGLEKKTAKFFRRFFPIPRLASVWLRLPLAPFGMSRCDSLFVSADCAKISPENLRGNSGQMPFGEEIITVCVRKFFIAETLPQKNRKSREI